MDEISLLKVELEELVGTRADRIDQLAVFELGYALLKAAHVRAKSGYRTCRTWLHFIGTAARSVENHQLNREYHERSREADTLCQHQNYFVIMREELRLAALRTAGRVHHPEKRKTA
jgi:hypothetical protein